MRNLEDFSRNGGVVEIGDLKNVTFVQGVFQKHGMHYMTKPFTVSFIKYLTFLS